MQLDEVRGIAVIGLGYVGLPLAIELARKYTVVGFDINQRRVDELLKFYDGTREADVEELKFVQGTDTIGLSLSTQVEDIAHCNIYIVTVPTPVDQFKIPDLSILLSATKMVATVLKEGDLVIYESTVYPGCTEEDCVPILEQFSGLQYNQDFFCGYSPERINPGDKINRLVNITKVVSGSTPAIADFVNTLYKSIIIAGTYLAPSIKVAEASKAIENAQRDVNISFVNELALIFDRMDIDTADVLEAAGTKWNFLKYKPGLVGGHCIGVDPYYLTHKAKSLGYIPEVILSGRRVNENMGVFIANKVLKLILAKRDRIKGECVLILGFTFKENCPDTRNTRVIDIYKEITDFGMAADVYDPWADAVKVKQDYQIDLIHEIEPNKYVAYILAVAHELFLEIDYHSFKTEGGIIFDTKSFIERSFVDARL